MATIHSKNRNFVNTAAGLAARGTPKPLIMNIFAKIVCIVAFLTLPAMFEPAQARNGELRTSRYVYTGGVSAGKQHGYGVCRYTNGNVYYGFWDMGYKHGLGRLEYADGTIDFGRWKRGVLVKPKGKKFRAGRRAYGIDVAKYQKQIDWERLSLKARADGVVTGRSGSYQQPVLFALIKSTEGSTIVDPKFTRNFKEAARCGIIRGAYHFLSVSSTAKEQAQFYIDNTPLRKGDLPPILDLEIDKSIMERDHAKVCRIAKEWLKIIEEHYGVKPIIYTYNNYYRDYMKGHGFDGYDFWIARYGAEPSARRWEFWQFTDKGSVAGIDGKVDIDQFRGSFAELKKYVKNKGIQ